jgi:hypothetical protein
MEPKDKRSKQILKKLANYSNIPLQSDVIVVFYMINQSFDVSKTHKSPLITYIYF